MTGHSPDRTKGLIPAADREEPLTRALVLSTALAIIDEEGADGLSMRRLGKALDRNPMTLYRYAANKAALAGRASSRPCSNNWSSTRPIATG